MMIGNDDELYYYSERPTTLFTPSHHAQHAKVSIIHNTTSQPGQPTVSLNSPSAPHTPQSFSFLPPLHECYTQTIYHDTETCLIITKGLHTRKDPSLLQRGAYLSFINIIQPHSVEPKDPVTTSPVHRSMRQDTATGTAPQEGTVHLY